MSRDGLDDRFCAFLDILGFANFVNGLATAKPDTAGEIVRRLQNINAQFEAERHKFASDVRDEGALTYFSDSIFLSVSAEFDNAFNRLCHYAERIATALLIDGFLTRGAIVRGKIHHRDATVFGPAIVEAYRLESRIAKYPRIVISRGALGNQADVGNVGSKIVSSTDGPIRLNYLHFFERFADRVTAPDSAEFVASKRFTDRLGFLKAARDHLQQQILHTRDNPEIHEKIRWLAIDFNERLVARVQPGLLGWPERIQLDLIWLQ